MVEKPKKIRGAEAMAQWEAVRTKYERLRSVMDERARRWWAGSEALAYGRGGVSLVSDATGLSRSTVARGKREIVGEPEEREAGGSRIRRRGGGRKRVTENQPGLLGALEALVDPATRGDPMSPLRWTCKSLRQLSKELKARGYVVGIDTVASLLKTQNYSLQGTRKNLEGASHPDRNAQFEYIAAQSQQFVQSGEPVISVDTKKKEVVGPFKNAGREYQPKGTPELVRIHDFPDPELGKDIPYGVYDIARNNGWVNVGIDHDTADFAVESIRRWWMQMGSAEYPKARRLLITADAGGSNGYRVRAWKLHLQGLTDELGLEITVCHFPPGTSKWNKIEHRMFCHITKNWRGRPLVSHETIVSLIAAATTEKGLKIRAGLDTGKYPIGVKVSDQDLATMALERAAFHGEWNYTFMPRSAKTPSAGSPVVEIFD